MTPAPLLADLRRRLDHELAPGESVLWFDQPNPDVYARKASSRVFTVVWIGFIAVATVAMNQNATVANISVLPNLFILPFWAVGLWLATQGRRARWTASCTLYAVTDRRALILTHGESLEVRSFYASDLGKVVRREHSDGFDDLTLRQDLVSGTDAETTLKETGFFGIRNVRNVERLIENARRSESVR